jgi:hypothetical protein
MLETHVHKGWNIKLLPARYDHALWVCPYVCTKSGSEGGSVHRTVPAGRWDTKEEAKAASLAHATAWIEAQD